MHVYLNAFLTNTSFTFHVPSLITSNIFINELQEAFLAMIECTTGLYSWVSHPKLSGS